MDALPDDCPLCNKKGAIRDDQLHFLTCRKVQVLEVNARHDEVVNVLYRSALLMGIQAVREPAGLHSSDARCPDLQLVLPGRHIISDVCVTHPLAPSWITKACTTTGAARSNQTTKHRKYRETAAQLHAELLPFCVETYGGMAPDAIKLLSAMGDMGEERLGMWPRHVVIRQLMGSVATFVCLFVCYFVFDWWGVSTATQIRLYAGLLSVCLWGWAQSARLRVGVCVAFNRLVLSPLGR